MPLPSIVPINGQNYDFSHAEILLNGSRIPVKSINYRDSLEPGEVRGNHSQPLGRTRGQYEASGDVTLHRAERDYFLQLLGPGYMERTFDVVVMYANGTNPVSTDRLLHCRITGLDEGGSAGPDALETQFTLSLMLIERNGMRPMTQPLY